MADRVTIFEVGPRDGLQNEAKQIATVDKIALVDRLSACGFAKIEAASFVSPKWVPQMGDATEVMAGINRADGVRYAALTPNMRGLEAARAAGVDEVAIFGSASEGFSQANINCSKAEALARFAPVAEAADVPVRGYVSCVIACPYDGPVAPEDVADMAEKLLALGCYEVSLGDTIGAGTPKRVDAMLDAVLERVPAEALAGHFHDTGGRAVENVEASYTRGLRVFDAAVGGLGGCPYAPGAAGNVASEALVARFAQLGVETGIDAARLAEAGAFARGLRG
jgi:hydroxymethylglutaryl-CoA lyase